MTLGAVVIGRNEGERLVAALRSLQGRAARVVYVDSGSTDGSLARAQALGADTVELDLSVPFTAARARNAGLARLQQLVPDVDAVQFVDGDCEVRPGWLEAGQQALGQRPDVAVVCGRRRERHPEASRYNRLVDMEWDTPVGEALTCGGDALVRVAALRQVGGYDERLIAGEEPELCLRLRRAGHKVLRLDHEMTLHDAALSRFPQWWRRSVRWGHAFTELVALHGRTTERRWVRDLVSCIAWGGVLPLAALLLAVPTRGASLLLLLGYVVLGARIARHRRRRGDRPSDAGLYAAGCVLSKFAELQGALGFLWHTGVRGRRRPLIEYKDPAPPP